MFLETAVSSRIQGWRPPWAPEWLLGGRRSHSTQKGRLGCEAGIHPCFWDSLLQDSQLRHIPCPLGLLPSAALLSRSHTCPAELGSVTTGSALWDLATGCPPSLSF